MLRIVQPREQKNNVAGCPACSFDPCDVLVALPFVFSFVDRHL